VTAGELPAPLREWLEQDHHDVREGGPAEADGRPPECDPELVERVSQLVRPLRGTRRTFVAGCPVFHHPSGPPFAAAFGRSHVVVRGRVAPLGAPAAPVRGLPAGWTELDPEPDDVGFARGRELARTALAQAYDAAGAAAGGS
jgi:hypothetical protein